MYKLRNKFIFCNECYKHSVIKSGFYANNFGVSLAVTGNRLSIGDDNKVTGNVRTGATYVFDITTGELLETIDNHVPESSDAFGYYLEFIGDREPSIKDNEFKSKDNSETTSDTFAESNTGKNNGGMDRANKRYCK